MGGSLSQQRKGSISSQKKNSISDSEGTFGTPEAGSPVVEELLSQLDNSIHTVAADITNHILDSNSNQDATTAPPDETTSPNDGTFSLDQNLNVTKCSKSDLEEGLSSSSPQVNSQTRQLPLLPPLSLLIKPDPSEVDDDPPVIPDVSSGSNLTVDPDLLNGNMKADGMLSNAKLSCEINDSVVTNNINQNQGMTKDFCRKDDPHGGHATDEEKLAGSVGVKPERIQNVSGSQVTSKPVESEFNSVQYEDSCKLKRPSGGSEMQKTGSQVLDSICISEAEKQAILSLIREEVITKEAEVNEWKKKYEQGKQQVEEMRKIVAEYETTIAQMIEDEQRRTLSSQKALHAVTLEKEAALADLNSVERSLSDLFRRYESTKSNLDGFKKNEEVLKKCAQDYLARIKQEEQRYQTLKLHTEEKLNKANEEIATVRTKSSSENMALTASLRKEQMKNESLEQALQQKNQEIEELTKICDELIAKMGKSD
ncbi:transforming acidic coiled-coil-containing protein 1 isoform X3 [Oryzias melastigma]|uniref:transforming acidic coiled-coil-containing protein 1 isoform X3 n=1 Tax=Oryzias melastigma TaxID=30732 RepID=UPI000CF82383|nr:transforming acidic coiled-coil-containing protein 1 isoform X3 [Oryzias melastigma]